MTRRIHQIWLGERPIPERFERWMESWKSVFPDWEYRLWRSADLEELLPRMLCPHIFTTNQNVGLQSDVLRYELLRLHDGLNMYADCDFEALRRFDHLFQDGCFHYGDELPGRPSNAWMLSSEEHPIPRLMLEQIRHAINERVPADRDWRIVVKKTGPEALHRALNFWVGGEWEGETLHNRGTGIASKFGDDIVTFWRELLYPYHYSHHTWHAFSRDRYPLAVAAHHWGGSWQ